MNLKNYTSSVPVGQSISKIEEKLAQAGATHIAKSYDRGKPNGVLFQIDINGIPTTFKLPTKTDKVFEYMKRQKKGRLTNSQLETLRLQSERTAWKSTLEWVEIQLSMVALDQMDIVEVFLPYLYNTKTGQTFFEYQKDNDYKLLGEG